MFMNYLRVTTLLALIVVSNIASAAKWTTAGMTLSAYTSQTGHHYASMTQPEPGLFRIDMTGTFKQWGTVVATVNASQTSGVLGEDYTFYRPTPFGNGGACRLYRSRTEATFVNTNPLLTVDLFCNWVVKRSPGVPDCH
jgi:hypothetical protein